jgi:hypothetical protein
MAELKTYDVFICHASEDKADLVDPLAQALRQAGVSVWYDKFVLEWGDTLRNTIDRGLAHSRFGIVVFSPAFLKRKKWTEHELDGLFAREKGGNKVILPIWQNLASASSEAPSGRVQQKDWQDKVESYAASVVQVGGVGSRLTTRTAWLTAGEHAYLDADRFVQVGFNGGGDLMSLSARDGYEIIGCTSPTGNRVVEEHYPGWRRMLLEDKLKNEFVIYCKTSSS